MPLRDHMMAAAGEFIGTTMFLFLGEGGAKTAQLSRAASQTEVATVLSNESILFIATSFGLSLLVSAWLFYRITGGLFNPAITLALWLAGVLTSRRAIVLGVSQLLGGILAAALVLALLPSTNVSSVNTQLSAGVSIAQGFFIEMLCTSALIFSVFMLAVEKHRATYLAPIGIGLTLFTCHLFAVVWTGSGLNPARSFGPAVVSGVFPKEHWLYWIAPFCGGIFAVIYFEVLKTLKYNSVVLDQDSDKEITGLRPVHVRVYRFIRQDPNAEIPSFNTEEDLEKGGAPVGGANGDRVDSMKMDRTGNYSHEHSRANSSRRNGSAVGDRDPQQGTYNKPYFSRNPLDNVNAPGLELSAPTNTTHDTLH
ncbi:hypothetical protein CF326_g3974 [Tilletia indica]|uniref:Aquaporin n=1 Tax=Tilletia indica TaxID=43049 RepID=A0A177TT36_9BASI|nr:hypothetical protein CF326_g3974 [Tilletia indica]KAE8248640.1 hypothetical protein A4X13_0g5528 [Tilletia indica]